MTSLIINADDFGLTDGVTSVITEALEQGLASSTTAMVCVPGAEERIRRSKDNVRARAGVHLQLTAGRPLLPARQVPSLCEKNGTFLKPDRLSQVAIKDVEEEWEAQIATAEEWGLDPTHVDTHHAVHTKSADLLDVYCRVAARHRLPVRGGDGWIKAAMSRRGVQGTTTIIRHWSGGGGFDKLIEELNGALARGRSTDVIEIVSHPGVVDAQLRERSSLADERVTDLKSLKQLRDSGFLPQKRLELRSFREAFR